MAYNARGQTTAIAYGTGAQALYTYDDARGLMMRARTLQGATTLMDLSYTRLANGQISSITSGVGDGNDATRSWSYAYNGLGELVTATNSGSATLSRGYAYDAADNMVWNSGLCAGSSTAPNLSYPVAGPASLRPHAPATICGTGVSYDANGNTLSYDVDGAGAQPARSLVYDGENRPVIVVRNGVVTRFVYGPDG